MGDNRADYERPARGGRRPAGSSKQYYNPFNDSLSQRRGRSNGEWRHDLHDEVNPSPSRHLQINHLHYEVSEQELRGLFESIGPVTSGPRIQFDRSGRSLGKATVSMASVEDAEEAIAEFSGAKAKGQVIYVEFAPSRGRTERHHRGRSRSRSPEPRLNNGRGDSLGARLAGRDLGSRLTARDRDRHDRGTRYSHREPAAGAGRGARAAQGGRGGTRASRSDRSRRPATTVEDLDAELDAFMKGPPVERESKAGPVEAAETAETAETANAAETAETVPASHPSSTTAPLAPDAVPVSAAPQGADASEDVEMEL